MNFNLIHFLILFSTICFTVVTVFYFYQMQKKLNLLTEELKKAKKMASLADLRSALGIYPRISVEYENLKKFDVQRNRAGFAAPFGFINNQSMLVVAAIRSFHFTANSVTLFSGCGVTSESVLQEELSEVEKKRNSVKKMMGMNL